MLLLLSFAFDSENLKIFRKKEQFQFHKKQEKKVKNVLF